MYFYLQEINMWTLKLKNSIEFIHTKLNNLYNSNKAFIVNEQTEDIILENYKMLMKEMKSYLTTWTGVLYSWTGYPNKAKIILSPSGYLVTDNFYVMYFLSKSK